MNEEQFAEVVTLLTELIANQQIAHGKMDAQAERLAQIATLLVQIEANTAKGGKPK